MNTFLLEEVNQTGDASSRRLFISTRAKLFCACCNDDDDDDEAIEENTASDIDRDAHAGGGILWTAEEDAVLISANKRLGSKWTEVALLLPGRTKRIAIEMLRSTTSSNNTTGPCPQNMHFLNRQGRRRPGQK